MPSSLVPGLVSITFRALPPREIVKLIAECQLRSVEWGGDVHVPHGDVVRAKEVKQLSDDAGVAISAYGSYYRVAGAAGKTPSFDAVLDCAMALGAPIIRVWAGNVSSIKADEAHRATVAADLRHIATLAGKHGVRIGLEYHDGTLTDTPESTGVLLAAVPESNVFTYWQPRHGLSVEQNLAEIALLRPRLANVHVFHWWPTPATRLPLADGRNRWCEYLPALAPTPTTTEPRHVSLEFVKGDDPQQLRDDAKSLLELLQSVKR